MLIFWGWYILNFTSGREHHKRACMVTNLNPRDVQVKVSLRNYWGFTYVPSEMPPNLELNFRQLLFISAHSSLHHPLKLNK